MKFFFLFIASLSLSAYGSQEDPLQFTPRIDFKIEGGNNSIKSNLPSILLYKNDKWQIEDEKNFPPLEDWGNIRYLDLFYNISE